MILLQLTMLVTVQTTKIIILCVYLAVDDTRNCVDAEIPHTAAFTMCGFTYWNKFRVGSLHPLLLIYISN